MTSSLPCDAPPRFPHHHDETLAPDPDSPVVAEPVAGRVSGICTGAARSGPPVAGHEVAQTVKRRLAADRGKMISSAGNTAPPHFDL